MDQAIADRVYEYVGGVVGRFSSADIDIRTVIQGMVYGWRCPQCRGNPTLDDGTTCTRCNDGSGSTGLNVIEFTGTLANYKRKMYQRKSGVRWNNPQAAGRGQKVTEFDRTTVFFQVTDGAYAVNCCIHNFQDLYPCGMSDDALNRAQEIVLMASARSTKVRVRGIPAPLENEGDGYVFVGSIMVDPGETTSLLSDEDMFAFIQLCNDLNVTPLDVAKHELFKIYMADQFTQEAILLFCLSPTNKLEMLHMMFITAPGEGKDFMVDNIIQRVSKCGKVGDVSVTTKVGLTGAIDPNDYTKRHTGTLEKYHKHHLAVTEFQTWEEDTWSALLSVLADGYYPVSKGAISERYIDAMMNVALMGNPPRDYDEVSSNKMDALHMFGDSAKQIISRFTLIINRTHLLDEAMLRKRRDVIFDNIDGTTERRMDRRLTDFQGFFREYFKKVSVITVLSKPRRQTIFEVFDALSKKKEFGVVLGGKYEDPRKLPQFFNLIKYYSRVKGHITQQEDGSMIGYVTDDDISNAADLFTRALSTLVRNFDMSQFANEIGYFDRKVYEYLLMHPNKTPSDIKNNVSGIESITTVTASLRFLESRGLIQNVSGAYSVVPSSDVEKSVRITTLLDFNFDKIDISLQKELSLDPFTTKRVLGFYRKHGHRLKSADEFSNELYSALDGNIDREVGKKAYDVLKRFNGRD